MLEFIREAPGMVEQLSSEELEKYTEACVKTADKKILTLGDYQSWAWESISRRTYKFHKRMYPPSLSFSIVFLFSFLSFIPWRSVLGKEKLMLRGSAEQLVEELGKVTKDQLVDLAKQMDP